MMSVLVSVYCITELWICVCSECSSLVSVEVSCVYGDLDVMSVCVSVSAVVASGCSIHSVSSDECL